MLTWVNFKFIIFIILYYIITCCGSYNTYNVFNMAVYETSEENKIKLIGASGETEYYIFCVLNKALYRYLSNNYPNKKFK